MDFDQTAILAFKDTQHFSGTRECMQAFLFDQSVLDSDTDRVLESRFHAAGLDISECRLAHTALDGLAEFYTYKFPIAQSEQVKAVAETIRSELTAPRQAANVLGLGKGSPPKHFVHGMGGGGGS